MTDFNATQTAIDRLNERLSQDRADDAVDLEATEKIDKCETCNGHGFTLSRRAKSYDEGVQCDTCSGSGRV